MNQSLLQVLITGIKTKITPILTKLRYWTNWNYIRTQGINKLRQFFLQLLDVRPKHKHDYYEVFGWLISKKLAFAVVVSIGVLSLYYLTGVRQTLKGGGQADGIKTYSYDSILLRFAKDRVRIKGRSGYLAYEGNVDKGYAVGSGILYNPQGNVVYQGSFVKSKYEGQGVLYHTNGMMKYTGQFSENLFEGQGKLYRENGSLWYDGQFVRGMKEGEGKLFDLGSNQIYNGNFSKDEILYSDLLGKTAQEIQQCYTGNLMAYQGNGSFVVAMEDINAMYVGETDSNSLYDGLKAENVYVLENYFAYGKERLTTIEELKSALGAPLYEGNSQVTLEEAVAINRLCKEKKVLHGPVEWEKIEEYKEYSSIQTFDSGYEVYLYGFEKDGLTYTFVCKDRNELFAFYYITKGQSNR